MIVLYGNNLSGSLEISKDELETFVSKWLWRGKLGFNVNAYNEAFEVSEYPCICILIIFYSKDRVMQRMLFKKLSLWYKFRYYWFIVVFILSRGKGIV